MDNMDMVDAYGWGEPEPLSFKFDPENLRIYWVTREGETIFIEDMTTSHIEAIVRGDLAGKFNVDKQSQHRLEIELSIRRRLGI